MIEAIGLMSVEDFAKLIKRPLNTVKTWKKRGELPEYLFKKVGGCVYVRENRIQEWIDSD